MEIEKVLIAFGLTLLAGLSTGIGSLMAFLSKKFNPKFLCGALGFSAGVMIYVSFIEIFFIAKASLVLTLGAKKGYIVTVISLFAGIIIMAIIDKLVPSYENPHEIRNIDMETYEKKKKEKKLLRMGLFSALAIGIHNFPEGLATFMGSLSNPALGLSIAIAIAIHNIPEGIAVSTPIYYATKNKKKAFWLSFLSGIAEPIGAVIGYFVLRIFMSDLTFGLIFAAVAGIMIYISFDELLPTAEEYGEHHIAIWSLISGMAIMAISLLLFV
ncbi:MAG: zinc transporter ZupT [Coxiella sp. DG_40]|nr:MAG: zinc transporter ZupT [Coxiella sp. DG_40]